jgi:prolyl oligopeptidase
MATEFLQYPATRTDDTIESRAGVDFPDPYRWLEGEDDEVRAWQRAQGQLAADTVRQWPHFEALRARVAHYSAERFGSLPRFSAGQWFRSEIPKGATQACAFVADTPFGPGRLLFDPTTENPDTPPFLSWISPSPDGRVLAIGVCADGSENNTIRLIDVASGELLPGAPEQVLMDNWTGGGTWLPDSSGLYFLAANVSDMTLVIHQHDMATATQTVTDIGVPHKREYALVTISTDGRYAVAHYGLMTPSPIAVRDLRESAWRPFVSDIAGTVAGHVIGDRYVAVTDVGAPRGRVVAIPIDSPTPNDPTTWKEIVPESAAVIRTLTPVAGLLYLSEFVDTYARVRIVDSAGQPAGEVPLPDRGAIAELPFPLMNLPAKGHPDEFLFALSSLTASWGVYRHLPGEGTAETLKAPDARLESALVEDHWATSADGTGIPYHVVRLPDAKTGAALIYAYGGFNAPWVPQFPVNGMATIVEAGGLFVHAHLRGGAEFGLEWWEGGRMQNKQNCYADLYAVAEDLIARGVTTRERLAVTGGSNGGLMAGVAVAQRPDLWKAVVPQVPIMDLIGALREPYAYVTSKIEFGDPENPDEVRRMAGFSPYHLIEEGTEYPAVFVVAGDTDPRCPPWHARKFAARLQAANSADTPILVHIWENVGHGWATDKDIQQTENTEWLAFVMQHLGLEPGTAR